MSHKLSYIVIGRNVADHIATCFDAIRQCNDVNKISNFEIIYVDSQSTDATIEIVKGYQDVKLYTVVGARNAAIGRNVGALEASGDVLYFIDADMEINASFLAEVFNPRQGLLYPVVSGLIQDVERGIKTDLRYHHLQLPFFAQETLDGGIFLIRRKLWREVNGMRTKYVTGEDGDLGLRLVAMQIPFTRIGKEITRHHTVSYQDPSRMWNMVWNKSVFYWRCVLYRDHLALRHMYGLLWKNDKSLIVLVLVLVVGACFKNLLVPLLLVYLGFILMRSLKQGNIKRIFEFWLYYLIVDLLNFVFFFTFHPQEKKLSYKKQ